MKERKEQVNVTQYFQVSEVLYYLTNLFIFIGLVVYTIRDVQNNLIPVGIADIIVLIIQIILFYLVFIGKVDRNVGLAIILVLSIFLFQLTAFVLSSEGGNISLQIAITTFMSLIFGSLAAFAVSKYMALFIGAVNLVFFLSITLYFADARMMDDIVVNSIIIIGYSIGMYYYRHSLEALADGLYRAYRTVKIQKLELEVLKNKAEQNIEINRPFVIFGRNASGLIHDLKNDLGLIDSDRQLLKMKSRTPGGVTSEDIDSLEEHVRRLTDRIETIKFAVSAKNFTKTESIPVTRLVQSTLYPFILSLDLKHRVIIKHEVVGEPVIYAPRFKMVQILENLVRNACEAIIDHQDQQIPEVIDEMHKQKAPANADAPDSLSIEDLFHEQEWIGQVRVEAKQLGQALYLSVSDNGPGIDFCRDCGGEDCLNCQEFDIGKTTKSYGTGIGMISVLEAVSDLGGAVRVISSPENGTRVEILLPLDKSVPLREELVREQGFVIRESHRFISGAE